MTILRDEAIFAVECDSCGECRDLDAETFAEAVAELKFDEWRISKPGGVWHHMCPPCIEDCDK